MKKLSFFIKNTFFLLFILTFLNSCGGFRSAPAKDIPVDVRERVKKNQEEGRGFRIFEKNNAGGAFQFASSNPLWRAS